MSSTKHVATPSDQPEVSLSVEQLSRRCHMAVAMALVLLLGACSTVRPWQNQPMHMSQDRAAAAQDTPVVGDPSMLMLVSMSGGGARAAAFGYGVLDALRQTQVHWQGRDTNLLDEIDVISGVSGGSIMAAYFAAFGKEAFPAFEQKFLRKNFQDNLISYALKPTNLHDLTSPWFGRSNLLERRLDELFKGKTFADIQSRPGQPALLVSATDLSLGSNFEFTGRQFSLICSDLDSVPLSFAVAASSAVPIALSPMTLKNFNGECPQPMDLKVSTATDYRARLLRESQRSYLDATARPYIHLVDGGLADNLGLRSVLDRAQGDGGIRDAVRHISRNKIKKLVIIAVNAERDPSERIDTSDQVPSTGQVIDALLFGTGARATHETLGLLKDTAQAWRRELGRIAPDGDDPFAPDAQIHVINVNLRDAPDVIGRSFLLQIPTAFSVAPAEVGLLIDAGHHILQESPEFKALLESMRIVDATLGVDTK